MERVVIKAAVVGASIPYFSAFQMSDSKLERNIQASLPSAFSAPLLHRSYHVCAKATGWPLISYTKKP